MLQSRFCASFLSVLLYSSVSAAPASDVVLEWNEITLAALEGFSPGEETRLAAITQAAVFEAVNAVTGEYDPYLAVRSARGASAEAAAVAAAHAALRHYAPDRAPELDAARARSLASIHDGPAKVAGVATGEAAAAAMIAHRANDGSTPPEFYTPTAKEPGAWRLTANCTHGVFLHLRNVKPFAIRSAGQFRVPPPPALTGRRYAAAYNEVKRVGAKYSTERPQDRADVARFYAAVLSIRTWNPVARQAAIAQGRSLTDNARALALLNMAMSDALVAVFRTKYRTPFWRPETAIAAGDADGNRQTRGDAAFEPFITTPCHPSYASAHASTAYAARTVLEKIYGRGGHTITLASEAVPDIVLQYRSFAQITADIDDARVYGGIHYRFDQDAGARLGRRIGAYVYRHHLRPAHGGKAQTDAMDAGLRQRSPPAI
jgi:hypothetical protein